ncbi:aldehyde-alcohol dehydrogenase [Clostridium acetireducens DSM 10703]|jgi:alcohol dehydrogenase class IV|uniref:Aldehyde-alcohol dehydrogenase n=1 Tax=Clostridium acetireducens DSM 10703 TaxID=1121290 RepID=A0A1E8EX22_9CLOT|nr:iron-containing alcohol dehydrogenase [Clostridium acetireducens]OFI05066.1 aldehyde-alcohol dehydrogenase [Clostridium acetireducens DSM 10703]
MKNLIFGGEKLVTGVGSIKYIEKIENKNVFIVTGGKSMFKNGTIDYIKEVLEKNKCEIYVHSGIKSNPDTKEVLKGLESMKKFNPDIVIAVGGGSSIDAAKVMAILYENPEINFENILDKRLPNKRNKIRFIAIPSTSGTGSEVTRSAVVTFKKDNIKIGLKSKGFIPDIAILDANLTMTMPDNVVAETGMDAVTHAVECYINNKSEDFTQSLAKEAIYGLLKYLPISYKEKTIESREKVHNYQCMAGLAFANIGLGMAHGIAHAIGGAFNLGHGLTNAIVLPYVLRYNYRDETVKLKLEDLCSNLINGDFILSVRELNKVLNIPKSFKEAGILEEDFKSNMDILIKNSLKGSTKTNPVPISEEQMEKLLNYVYYGKKISAVDDI